MSNEKPSYEDLAIIYALIYQARNLSVANPPYSIRALAVEASEVFLRTMSKQDLEKIIKTKNWKVHTS